MLNLNQNLFGIIWVQMTSNKSVDSVLIENGIRLSVSDRFYMGISRTDVSKNLIHVYTLACPSDGRGGFYLTPVTEVATFSSSDAANAYVNTVAQIALLQCKYPLHGTLCRVLRSERKRFRQHTR